MPPRRSSQARSGRTPAAGRGALQSGGGARPSQPPPVVSGLLGGRPGVVGRGLALFVPVPRCFGAPRDRDVRVNLLERCGRKRSRFGSRTWQKVLQQVEAGRCGGRGAHSSALFGPRTRDREGRHRKTLAAVIGGQERVVFVLSWPRCHDTMLPCFHVAPEAWAASLRSACAPLVSFRA